MPRLTFLYATALCATDAIIYGRRGPLVMLGRGRFSTLHPPTPPCLENPSQDGGSTGSKPLDPSFIYRARLLILEISSQANGLPLSRRCTMVARFMIFADDI